MHAEAENAENPQRVPPPAKRAAASTTGRRREAAGRDFLFVNGCREAFSAAFVVALGFSWMTRGEILV